MTAQAISPRRFEDYPAGKIFEGAPAAPIIATKWDRMFRTRIREGVVNGKGVYRDGKEQAGPNFAGHYIVVEWECGSACHMMAIIDAATGRIYSPPSPEGLPPSPPETGPVDPDGLIPWLTEVHFRRNSKMMVVDGTSDFSKGRTNYAHYFLWENDRWKFLDRVPMKP